MTSNSTMSGVTPRTELRDSRTLLPGRESFYPDVEPLLAGKGGESASLVLLVIDIDGLEFVLRTFGPEARDLVVREVGDRIQNVTESEETPYHITQDRFAVILREGTYRHVTRRARALTEAFGAPFRVSGVSYQLQAFVGISNYPSHADSLNELVRTAVFACHHAREVESHFATFDEKSDEAARHRFHLMVDLERALENQHEIRLAYQPLIDLNSGRCVGVEGLCRWHHPTLGAIPPGRFLPFVEQTPLMMPLTETTLSLGLRDLMAWQAKGFDGSLAINLSPGLFRRADMLERLLEHFRFSNMSQDAVHFEITETGIMDQPSRAINTLGGIRRGGSKIAVDDFGTGHSSLAYLADLPVDIIKIDKYFVQSLSKPWGRAIVGAAVMLAKQLGLTTVAEGIEKESQFNQCRELGVTIGQGYYMSHPLPRQEFEQWLHSS